MYFSIDFHASKNEFLVEIYQTEIINDLKVTMMMTSISIMIQIHKYSEAVVLFSMANIGSLVVIIIKSRFESNLFYNEMIVNT